jgi:hypothetical protein
MMMRNLCAVSHFFSPVAAIASPIGAVNSQVEE